MENQRSTSFNDRLSPVNRASPVGRASPLSKPNSIGRNSPVSRANLISKVEKPLPKDSIIIDNAQLNLVENIKNEGNHYFKLGQFTRSIENYTKAIESIPNEHSSLIVIYNNRANSYSKMGNFKNSLNDSELALKIIGEDYEYVPKQKLEGKAGLNLKDYYVKGMLRKAEALEALERFKEAEETYAKLLFLSNCSAHNKALEGARRCKKGLEMPKLEKKGSEAGGRNDKLDSLLSEFSTDFDKQEIDSSEAVKKIRELENIKNQEETIRIQTIDSIEAKVKSWKSSKEDNLRALLASLDDVLWGELNWKKVPIHDLLDLKKVKRVYMLAIAKLHPDKLTSSATVEQKLLAASIFTTLNLAWDQFKLQNNL
ncbi:TPR-like protein [Neoconidiobolus thromboides FSU 785]|nr:TPR-like protein [Neoconidiobolus thromboides FSU 785]